MKIYTKTGDKGLTSLFGGERVPKYHYRIEAYGTVDELNAHIGLLRDQPIDETTIEVLLEIQDRLFTLGSILATEHGNTKVKTPQLHTKDIEFLEKEMDKMNEHLPEMRSFVLPGGHQIVSYCHIARCVCRRAERLVVFLGEKEPINDEILIYLNRLSDYLFVLSRKLSVDFNANEIPWKARY
ncbi:MAG: ATP:cob(I)alamin adenosyltransferase [Bacteroidetes bacterium HGW-Bacteroidetes-12]|jgi:cob(I)alamin adenosyltransferase|nr:MAG: ATP:cob(I)alamin adenosyltransferase [Bacteroidetes bacterium HGW-Bacteroidetes-12]